MAYGTMMSRSPSSSGLLPMPGSPGSSWAVYKERFRAIFRGADAFVLIAFWLFGLINNVCYVIILSAALDLVGPSVPKSVVLLADVLPSFLAKLIAPYFIHKISYPLRIIIMCALSASGMFIIALTPLSIPIKLFGVAVASLSSGIGELSMLGLTHYYGHFSLAAWGSGTGGAGLIGAGLYVLLTSTIALSVKTSLLACAFLPFILPMAFFFILPQGPLKNAHAHNNRDYEAVPQISISDEDIQELPIDAAASSLLAPGPSLVAEAYTSHSPRPRSPNLTKSFSTNQVGSKFMTNLRRTKALFIPYMAPLLLVYIAEYTINQGVTPTLLFPIKSSPFDAYRSFYPTYALIYQLGVFISRSSSPFFRFHALYIPSLLQIANLLLLIFHSIYFFIPSVWIVFIVIFWEGLLGGLVYISTFAEIMDNVPVEEREFSLGATSVSDSGGICIASFLGMVIEPWLCGVNVGRGRPWCRSLGA